MGDTEFERRALLAGASVDHRQVCDTNIHNKDFLQLSQCIPGDALNL